MRFRKKPVVIEATQWFKNGTTRRTENMSHQPKGGMCTSCAKWREDCSSLPFETMPVIVETPSGVTIVRCTEHVRSNVELTCRQRREGETNE